MEHENVDCTNCNFSFRYIQQMIDTRTGGLGNKRTSRDNPDYCIIEIVQNTEKSPEDLRRLAVTETPRRREKLSRSSYNDLNNPEIDVQWNGKFSFVDAKEFGN